MSLPYWEYFLSIESDLERCSRFGELTHKNYRTYSVEFARIIMAASSEFDTLAKQLCANIDPTQTPTNIRQYYPIIVSRYPKLTEFKIRIPRYKLSFKPWLRWNANNSPDWWSKGYNKIKHDRDQHFHQANLFNAILSTAGLLIGILYFYDSKFGSIPEIDLFQSPKLFEPEDYSPSGFEPGGISWSYSLLR